MDISSASVNDVMMKSKRWTNTADLKVDVPLRNYSLTHCIPFHIPHIRLKIELTRRNVSTKDKTNDKTI